MFVVLGHMFLKKMEKYCFILLRSRTKASKSDLVSELGVCVCKFYP